MAERGVSYDDLVQEARLAYRELHLTEALEAYRVAAELEPNRHEAHLGIARSLTRMRDHEGAREAAERCIELAPERFEGHAALGVLHFLIDDNDEARRCLEHAVELAPEDPEPRLTLAQVLSDLKEPDQAMQELELAREMMPNIVDDRQRQELTALAWHVETYIHLSTGSSAQAMVSAQEVIAMGDVNPYAACLAYSNMGILEARAGRGHYDQAIEYLEKSFGMNPYFYRAGYALGRLLMIRNQRERAVEVLSQVVEAAPADSASMRHAYAMALAKTGQRQEAVVQFQQALDDGVGGIDRLIARWQVIWQSSVGRYVVIGLILLAILLWIVLTQPSAQVMTLLLLAAVIIGLQKILGRRGK